MTYKTKAEKAFEKKVQYAMDRNDWKMVTEVTEQFEAYERLVEPMCDYEDVWTDEVGHIPICKIHNNNSKHSHAKGMHRPCLTIDPYEIELVPQEDPTVIEEQAALLSGEIERTSRIFGFLQRS